MDRAIKKEPKIASYRINQGLIYGRSGNLKKTFINYEEALRNNQYYNNFPNIQSHSINLWENNLFKIKILTFFWQVRDSQDALGYLTRGMSRALFFGNQQQGIADLQVAANLFRQQGKQNEAKKVVDMIMQIKKIIVINFVLR